MKAGYLRGFLAVGLVLSNDVVNSAQFFVCKGFLSGLRIHGLLGFHRELGQMVLGHQLAVHEGDLREKLQELEMVCERELTLVNQNSL